MNGTGGRRKASYSMNSDCVEAGWRKPSRSTHNGNCVETASGAGLVAVRDTQDREGTVLTVTARAWRTFLTAVKP